MDNHDIYRAGIVVDSYDGVSLGIGYEATDRGIKGGTVGGQEASASSFALLSTSTITGVKLRLKKVGTPADTLNIDIVSTRGGSSLANATQSASALTTSYVEYTYVFGTPVSLTGGTKYYIQLTRSPDNLDGTNYVAIGSPFNLNYGSGYGQSLRGGGVWGSEDNGFNQYFILVGQAGFTKLEPQYLLANTLFAAGTALQTFLTNFISTEWDAGSGTITYYFQVEAADGSTSDVELWEADGGGAGLGVLTNIDNAQISSAVTMPASQNMDTKATTNAGDVAAARILVAYVFSAALSGSVKTKKGLAIASVKTFKGLATASVKTDKGLSLT
jgi:hypothetical protein